MRLYAGYIDKSLVRVERIYISHILVSELEVEYVTVLCHVLFARTLRYGHNVSLVEPPKGHLCRTFAIFTTDPIKYRIFQ